METTYEVIAKTANGNDASVTLGNLAFMHASAVAVILSEAYRDIAIVCEQTGEVAYNHYWSSEFFNKKDTQLGAVQKAMLFLINR